MCFMAIKHQSHDSNYFISIMDIDFISKMRLSQRNASSLDNSSQIAKINKQAFHRTQVKRINRNLK